MQVRLRAKNSWSELATTPCNLNFHLIFSFLGIIYWTGFFVAIYAFWTKPDLDDFRRDVREANSLVAPSAPFGMNERSKCFLEETNAAIGRHQIVPMNFMIFTLFYRNKFDTKVFNPVSTCDNVNLGFLEKLKGKNLRSRGFRFKCT